MTANTWAGMLVAATPWLTPFTKKSRSPPPDFSTPTFPTNQRSVLCQTIRIKNYLVTLLQFIKVCSIVLIDAATNQRWVLFSINQSAIRYQSYYLRPSLRILLPLMIQVPSLSSVALLGKGVSNMFGSHWVIPISMDPLQLWIFLSILTWSTEKHWFWQFIEFYCRRWSKETMRLR